MTKHWSLLIHKHNKQHPHNWIGFREISIITGHRKLQLLHRDSTSRHSSQRSLLYHSGNWLYYYKCAGGGIKSQTSSLSAMTRRRNSDVSVPSFWRFIRSSSVSRIAFCVCSQHHKIKQNQSGNNGQQKSTKLKTMHQLLSSLWGAW